METVMWRFIFVVVIGLVMSEEKNYYNFYHIFRIAISFIFKKKKKCSFHLFFHKENNFVD